MNEVLSYLKYKITSEKLMFVGWIFFSYVLVEVFTDYEGHGKLIVGFLMLMQEAKITNKHEKLLPINKKNKRIALVIYATIVMTIGQGFGMIEDNALKKGIIVVWLLIFGVKSSIRWYRESKVANKEIKSTKDSTVYKVLKDFERNTK